MHRTAVVGISMLSVTVPEIHVSLFPLWVAMWWVQNGLLKNRRKARYTLATKLNSTRSTVAETGNKSATKSTVAVYVQPCCRFWQQIGNNVNSTACRGRLCCWYVQLYCRYGQLCCQSVRGLTFYCSSETIHENFLVCFWEKKLRYVYALRHETNEQPNRHTRQRRRVKPPPAFQAEGGLISRLIASWRMSDDAARY